MKSFFRKLAPVGDFIETQVDENPDSFLDKIFSPYSWNLYDSGTSALASAITAAKSRKTSTQPEIIIPAYACPDLVSAAEFAGVKVNLVNFEKDRPWMDLELVAAMINENTVAVVAVNFLGIPERIKQLVDIARSVDALVIDDSAQAFPVGHDSNFWTADIVVLSFGRGKPVSVLGGGAVLYRRNVIDLTRPTVVNFKRNTRIVDRYPNIEISLYNILIRPRCFWVTNWLPFLSLGDTVFEPLQEISGMQFERKSRLPKNIRAYQSGKHVESHDVIREIFESIAGDNSMLVDLPVVCGLSKSRKLLRYPILLASGQRDVILDELTRDGLGGSKLYADILPKIAGVRDVIGPSQTHEQSLEFARRLITIPVHEGVKKEDLENIRDTLKLRINSN